MKNIAFFNSSGISAESGIKTFRDVFNGLWNVNRQQKVD
jgi:hypothetical protein